MASRSDNTCIASRSFPHRSVVSGSRPQRVPLRYSRALVGPQRVIRSIRACSSKVERRTSDTSAVLGLLFSVSTIALPPIHIHTTLIANPVLSPALSTLSDALSLSGALYRHIPVLSSDQDVRHSYQHNPDTPPRPADRPPSPLIALPSSIRPGQSQGQGKGWERRSICARAAGHFGPIAQSGH